MTPPPKILYVGGEGRSGTTLLDQILGQIPGVASTGELFAIWEHGVLDDDRCGCGAAFSECPIWREVGEVAFGGWHAAEAAHAFDVRRALVRDRYAPWLLTRRKWHSRLQEGDKYLDMLDRLYRAIHTVTGASVIVDSSKFVGYAMALAHIPDVDLRIVQLVRDARGAAYSWTKVIEKPESTHGAVEMDRYPPVATAARWVKTDAMFLALRATGVPLLTVRYEDLIADPPGTVRRISDFGRLPAVDGALQAVLDDSVVLQPTHTVAGNPSRFRTGAIRLRVDEAWRQELPWPQQAIVTAVGSPGLLRHGYLHRRSSHMPDSSC